MNPSPAPLPLAGQPARANPPAAFEVVSLSRQFQIGSLLLLLVGMLTFGFWLTSQIERGVTQRAGSIAAAYGESILSHGLAAWDGDGPLSVTVIEELDHIFVDSRLQRKVVRFKLWDRHGTIRYSSDAKQIGQRFPPHPALASALAGEIQTSYSTLDAPDNLLERQQWRHLLEVYVPIRTKGSGDVIGVAEFYHSTENLEREIAQAKRRAWGLIATTTAVVYLLLLGLIRRANRTIVRQRHDLEQQLVQLQDALAENERMRVRLQDAGERTTALNEQLLLRIAADLHDGPAQALAFSLLRFEDIANQCGSLPACEVTQISTAMRDALDELRAIAADLPLPGLDALDLTATAQRAVADGRRVSGKTVQDEIAANMGDAPLAVKIALYRILKESLANSWRHAPGPPPRLAVWQHDDVVEIRLEDAGTGFDVASASASGRLGLAFMRERVRMLGGECSIDSRLGAGTRIRATIPLRMQEERHD